MMEIMAGRKVGILTSWQLNYYITVRVGIQPFLGPTQNHVQHWIKHVDLGTGCAREARCQRDDEHRVDPGCNQKDMRPTQSRGQKPLGQV